MKKTYINPELLVVKIATHQMLASSPATFDGSGSGEINLTDDDFSVGDDEVLSREDDFDMDDEEI